MQIGRTKLTRLLLILFLPPFFSLGGTLLVKRFTNNIHSLSYQYMIDNHFQFVITIILDSKLNSRIACLNKTIQDFRHFGEVNITLRAIRNGIYI